MFAKKINQLVFLTKKHQNAAPSSI